MNTFLKKSVRKFHIAKVLALRLISANKRNAGPASGEKKWEVIDMLRKNNGIDIFVETGTYHGDTVKHFKNTFKKIYSIEIGHDLAANAKKRFAKDLHVEIVEGDSANALSLILQKLTKPAVFWLDAHCSEGDTEKGDDYSPILKELEAILSKDQKHVIAIDDARLFDGVNYPTLRKVQKLVARIRPNSVFEVTDDITRIYQK